jgi:hypothetical protein
MGKCFICEDDIDLVVHKDSIDIDHVIPTQMHGKDDPSNFALTHSSCNRSKQASNLNVARILHTLGRISNEVQVENRGANLGDILNRYGGSTNTLSFSRNETKIKFSCSAIGNNDIFDETIYKDELSGFEYFFCKIPIEYVVHDNRINPRPLGQNISKLIEEFNNKRPQLHVSLGWIDISASSDSTIHVFDGQHKAAAQVLLGIRSLPIRVFINPDHEILLTTNTNAGTTLRQVEFGQSVRRHLGNALYRDRVEKYKHDMKFSEEFWNFSERDLLTYFRGESSELKRYVIDSVRDSITHSSENKLQEYILFTGKSKDKPLSYSCIENTFYSLFIFKDVLDTPINYKLDEGENPRQLEKAQIIRLMNIIAEEIYIGKFDLEIGANRIENRIQSGENLPLDHIRAFRIGREEIMQNWLRYIKQIIHYQFVLSGKPIHAEKLFQYRFPEPLWDIMRIFIKNFRNLPLWINKELSSTIFGAKQNPGFWQTIFETGRSNQGVPVLAEPIDLTKMLSE